jgi:hypothetical protein
MSIQALAELWLISVADRKHRLLMITLPYHAYMDESIQQRDGREIIAMAGYISSFAQWIDFEQEW